MDAGSYLFEAFCELGMVQSGLSGLLPLSWTEIDAFARLTKAFAEPWEARLIRRLSNAYLEGHRLGADPVGIPPWTD